MKSMRGKPNEQLFPRQVIIQLTKICHSHVKIFINRSSRETNKSLIDNMMKQI